MSKSISMMKMCRLLRRVLPFLLMTAILVSLLFVLSHHCEGEDCPLCLLNKEEREILWLPLACILSILCGEWGGGFMGNRAFWIHLRGGSPVMLKVKLSN